MTAVLGGTNKKSARLAALAALDLELFLAIRGYFSEKTQDAVGFVSSITNAVLDAKWSEFAQLAQESHSVAFDLVVRDRISLHDYLEWHRFSSIFVRRESVIGIGWPSAAEYLMQVWGYREPNADDDMGSTWRVLGELGGVMLTQPVPWPRAGQLGTVMAGYEYSLHMTPKLNCQQLEPEASFAGFCLFAASAEAAVRSRTGAASIADILQRSYGRIGLLAPLLRRRFDEDMQASGEFDEAISALNLNADQAVFVRSWCDGAFDLVPSRSKPAAR
jgi:hypothetical protein